MSAHYGSHEIAEIHEVLNYAINTLNTFRLYRPHIRHNILWGLLEKHIEFMINEYNNLVFAVQNNEMRQAIPYRAPMKQEVPLYGIDNLRPQYPNTSMEEIDDRDIASAILGAHKAGALVKMTGALECANPTLRRMLQESANNCSEMAYEIWQYMNHFGYYQVPTLLERTSEAILNNYSQIDHKTNSIYSQLR